MRKTSASAHELERAPRGRRRSRAPGRCCACPGWGAPSAAGTSPRRRRRRRGVSPRWASPVSACSTLMTSAPQSASTAPADGVKVNCATSTIFTPFIGWSATARLLSPRARTGKGILWHHSTHSPMTRPPQLRPARPRQRGRVRRAGHGAGRHLPQLRRPQLRHRRAGAARRLHLRVPPARRAADPDPRACPSTHRPRRPAGRCRRRSLAHPRRSRRSSASCSTSSVFRPLRNHAPVAKAVASLGVMVLFTAAMTHQVGGDQVLVDADPPRTRPGSSATSGSSATGSGSSS